MTVKMSCLFLLTHDNKLFYPASEHQSPEEYPHGIVNIPCTKGTNFLEFSRELAFQRLVDFSPDLMLLSAGFDAHELDALNMSFLSLDEDDYIWITESLIRIVNTCNSALVSPFAQSLFTPTTASQSQSEVIRAERKQQFAPSTQNTLRRKPSYPLL